LFTIQDDERGGAQLLSETDDSQRSQRTLTSRPQGVVQFIEGWQPVDFGSWNGKLALILIFVILGAVLFLKRTWRLDEVLLTAFALWSALSHTRFLFFAGLILVPILAPSLKLFPAYDREMDEPWLNAAIMAGIVVAIVFLFPSQAQLRSKVTAEFPQSALDFMQRQDIQGKILNDYGWGGYIEWNTPQYKPFIDGRSRTFLSTTVRFMISSRQQYSTAPSRSSTSTKSTTC
jgi:hypothetical protein